MCAMGATEVPARYFLTEVPARYLPGGRFLAVGFFLLLISAAETSANTLPDPQQKQNAAVCNPARSDVGTSGSFVCDPTSHLSALAAGNIDLVAKQLKDKGSAVGVAVIADLSVLAGTRPSSAQESFNVSWHCSSSATQVAREHLTSWKVDALILIGLNDKEFCVERRLGRFELGERDDAHLIADVQELLVLKLTSHAVVQTISVLKESATHGTERRGAKSKVEEPTEQEPAGTRSIKERVGPDSAGKAHRNFIASMLPFKGFAFPPKPGVACPKCDGIHAEMWEMQKSWESLWPSWKWEAEHGLPEDQGQGTFLLARMQLGMQSMCMEQNGWTDRCYSNNFGCYVSTANSAPQFRQKGGAATCDKVPFREIVHAITAYALNGSNMSVEFSWNTDQVYPDRGRIEVPNSWFVQTVVGIQWAINALPMDLWKALKLGDTMPGPEGTQVPSAPPYPSITEAFSTLMANKTLRYIEASMESWPWVPPPPPPPPTPPPCPGGSLQECMKLCPKTEGYKSCVQECLDVCLFSKLNDELRTNKDELRVSNHT